jgi:hypothetical protein
VTPNENNIIEALEELRAAAAYLPPDDATRRALFLLTSTLEAVARFISRQAQRRARLERDDRLLSQHLKRFLGTLNSLDLEEGNRAWTALTQFLDEDERRPDAGSTAPPA